MCSSDLGFRQAQVRLAPARLTHCMRWLGSARRAHDTALDYANRREVFGQKLGKHEGVGFMLADNEMDIRTARLSLMQAAWLLDQKGWKGKQRGGAAVDQDHALVLVNRADASGEDIILLAQDMSISVLQSFGIALQSEVCIV